VGPGGGRGDRLGRWVDQGDETREKPSEAEKKEKTCFLSFPPFFSLPSRKLSRLPSYLRIASRVSHRPFPFVGAFPLFSAVDVAEAAFVRREAPFLLLSSPSSSFANLVGVESFKAQAVTLLSPPPFRFVNSESAQREAASAAAGRVSLAKLSQPSSPAAATQYAINDGSISPNNGRRKAGRY
jgi:hypothetical protein